MDLEPFFSTSLPKLPALKEQQGTSVTIRTPNEYCKCIEGLARKAPHVSHECVGGLAREAPHVSHGNSPLRRAARQFELGPSLIAERLGRTVRTILCLNGCDPSLVEVDHCLGYDPSLVLRWATRANFRRRAARW